MTIPRWRDEPISRAHDRDAFDCGEPALNEYLRRYARQNHEHGGAKTFVATADGRTILGYYALSPASIAYARVPAVLARAAGRYEFPAFRLSRLAVDRRHQGQGLGGLLLAAAARRCVRAAAEVGGSAMLIDAKNERVAAWYAGFGALPLLDARLSLLLPLASIARFLDDGE